MENKSILFLTEQTLETNEPDFFPDLNLNQVIRKIIRGREEYNLSPYFYTPLGDPESIVFRQRVMKDLADKNLVINLKSFSEDMRQMRRCLKLLEQLSYKRNMEGWFLRAVELYCNAVLSLIRDLGRADLRSQGLRVFRDYLTAYGESEHFLALAEETKGLRADLSKIRYCLHIKGNRIMVSKYKAQTNLSREVENTFAIFKQGEAKDYLVNFPANAGMSHVEARIINIVARLYPDVFARLEHYCAANSGFLNPGISDFDREIQFYLAYLDYISELETAHLAFCYPEITRDKQIYSNDTFDLGLAKLITEKQPVIVNDFYLRNPERTIVVSGPNQGGKTTFARAFGQLHYLAAMGLPVPGSKARLNLFDRIFTHFEREENIQDLHGKLQDELIRVHGILTHASTKSIIIMNEVFSSTTLQDGVFLGKKVIEAICRLDCLCVCVTFLEELPDLSEKTVSMVSTVSPDNPVLRTFKIVRKPPDGLSYALSIAEKYGLTYSCIKERIQ